MMYRVNFAENGRMFHAFIDAPGSDEAVGKLKKTLPSDRQIAVTESFMGEPPCVISKPSDRLNPLDRVVKSETRVALNDG